MSTITQRLSVDQYDQMVENGILPESNRFELLQGRIVEKDVRSPEHVWATSEVSAAIERLLPGGWHVRKEDPVRIPQYDEPEPDVSVVRGTRRDYLNRHPEPADVALIVEVSRSTVYDDRAMAPIYGAGGIPYYWILNLAERQLEVYAGPGPRPQGGVGGAYPAPTILDESASVELVINGQQLGRIAVADLLP